MHVRPAIIRLLFVLSVIFGLLLVGSLGYAYIEGWPIKDGFYMTVITLSTVGYGETQPLSGLGRWFTSCVICLGIIGMTCLTATITSLLVESDLASDYAKKRMQRMIDSLNGHVVVCGTTLTAQAVIDRLMAAKQTIVVIDKDAAAIEEIRSRYRRVMFVHGDPTDELRLAAANVLNAAHVVVATDSEIDNLLISITCLDLGADITVHAQCSDTTIANRMRKAGVEDVISPPQLCGEHLSSSILA